MGEIKEFFDKTNEKFYSFPIWKKGIVILMVILLFIGMYFLATAKTIETYSFPSGCKETYINGKLNGSECTYDREQMKNKIDFQFDPNIVGNLTYP